MVAERFPVEEGAILQFARAIGDLNPAYRYPGLGNDGILAPPTFVQCAMQYDDEFPLRPRDGEAWLGSGRTPTGKPAGGGSGTGVLHAEQHFEYHRHPRAGDVLTATARAGATWEKEGRSGQLRFSETITEFRDEGGELVVTATSVAVLTLPRGAS